MKDFFNFKKILIPTIIPLVFKFGLYFFIIVGIYGIYELNTNIQHFRNIHLYESLRFLFRWFVLYPITLRIVCEVLIILARMNDSLTDVKEQLNTQRENENT